MPFFSDATLAAVRQDPTLFNVASFDADLARFEDYLGPKFSAVPIEYLKFMYAATLAYESAPYGYSYGNDVATLLSQPTLQCTSYANLTWLLYNQLSPSGALDVAHFGWAAGPVGGHAEMMISEAGFESLIIDPTILRFGFVDGINEFTSGVGIDPSDQLELGWRGDAPGGPQVVEFAANVAYAWTNGLFRAGHLQYWANSEDLNGQYAPSGSIDIPLPENERIVQGGVTNDSTIGGLTTYDQHTIQKPSTTFIGSASNDWIRGTPFSETIFGGAQFTAGTTAPHIDHARTSSFISTADLAGFLANPSAANISALYTAYRSSFISTLGTAFAHVPELELQLAFASTLAYDLKPAGTSHVYSLAGALAAPGLDVQSLTILAWNLFELLTPGQNWSSQTDAPDISMVGWNGGPSGQDAQLILNIAGAPSILVDTSTAQIALIQDFNSLAAGEAVPLIAQASTYWRGDDAHRDAVIASLDQGLYRTGNLAYWLEGPSSLQFFDALPDWATPQGDAVKIGAGQSSVFGSITARDTINGGAGADILAHGLVFNDGTWGLNAIPLSTALVGDFNGDGRADILSNGAVYRSTGDSFVNAGTWTSVAAPLGKFFVGDFNGDGKADLLIYSSSPTGTYGAGASVLLSNGTGFGAAASWNGSGVGSDHTWYVGDFNGDGKTDIARYSTGVGFQVLLSTGHSFGAPVTWTMAASTVGWLTGDFNGDGKTDIAQYNPTTHNFEVYLSTGTGFTDAGSWTTANPGSAGWTLADVDGDGKVDLIGDPSGIAGVSQVYYSNGSAFVAAPDWFPTAANQALWGDFNGDHNIDFVGASPTILPSPPTSALLSADFNGDGRADLLYYIASASSAYGAQVSLSQGLPNFADPTTWSGFGFGNAAGWYVGDFDGDGKSDIARYVTGAGLQVLTSNGKSFGAPVTWSAESSSTGWLVGDFNGDGKADVAHYVAGVGMEVALSNGASFGASTLWAAGSSPSDNKWIAGDFNGDGKTDLARYDPTTHQTEVFISAGDHFVDAGVWSTTNVGAGGWLAVADIDNDGKFDLVGDAAASGNSGKLIVVNSTGGGFNDALPTILSVNPQTQTFVFGDFNGDGKTEVLTGGQTVQTDTVNLGVGHEVAGADLFLEYSGQANGDTILDFRTGIDKLVFVGFGTSDQALITHSGDYWTITSGLDHHTETVHILGVTTLSASDFYFH